VRTLGGPREEAWWGVGDLRAMFNGTTQPSTRKWHKWRKRAQREGGEGGIGLPAWHVREAIKIKDKSGHKTWEATLSAWHVREAIKINHGGESKTLDEIFDTQHQGVAEGHAPHWRTSV
jgi:hypothetical protein